MSDYILADGQDGESVGEVVLRTVDFPCLSLDSGETLSPVTVAYETYGESEQRAQQRDPHTARALWGCPRRGILPQVNPGRAGGRR